MQDKWLKCDKGRTATQLKEASTIRSQKRSLWCLCSLWPRWPHSCPCSRPHCPVLLLSPVPPGLWTDQRQGDSGKEGFLYPTLELLASEAGREMTLADKITKVDTLGLKLTDHWQDPKCQAVLTYTENNVLGQSDFDRNLLSFRHPKMSLPCQYCRP